MAYMTNYTQQQTADVITYPCPNLKSVSFTERGTWYFIFSGMKVIKKGIRQKSR